MRTPADRRQRLLLVLLTTTVCLSGSAAVLAQPTPEQPRVRISDVNFTGVKGVSERELASVLTTRASSRFPWGDRHYFSRTAFGADLGRIDTFYANRGYPYARVVSYDIVPDGPNRVRITFNIEEGLPVTIASITWYGFEVLPADAIALLEKELPLKVGDVRTQDAYRAGRDLGENVLKEAGYPFARVQMLEGPGPGPGTVTLTLAAEPGNRANFGPIKITGNATVGENVIRRQLAFGEGDPFKLSRVLESQRRLYNLELFEVVNFTLPDLATQPAEVPVTTTIREGKHRRVQFNVGYGSEEQARVGVNWRNVNFLKAAHTSGVEAKWSSLDRGVRLNYRAPYFFSPSYRFELQPQIWYADEPAYELLTRGARATVSREIVRRDRYGRRRSSTRANVSFIDEYENYTVSEQALADPTFRDDLIALGLNPETGEGRGTLVAGVFNITHETAGSLLDARQGYVATLHLERAAKILQGDWEYFELTLEGRHYLPLASWGVLANRVRYGAIEPAGADLIGDAIDANVPFFKRYFLGGASSVRGWGRYEVSPLNSEGFPIGGLAFFEFSSELRFPVYGKLGGVFFLDGGRVDSRGWGVDMEDMFYALGSGVRYSTPIGPIRFDVAWQLNEIPGLLVEGEPQPRNFRLHVSIGQAF